ncbi:MAG: hypothetical protein AB1941_05115 [Gemmatimonadota bacterium]
MPTPERGASVDAIRAAAARAAKANGIRATAREVGMSVTGFRAFLDGSNPFASTREKLTAWYLRRAAAGEEKPTSSVVEAALAVLVEAIPPEKRADALRELVEAMERSYRAAGVPVPKWLKQFR